jgi:hypothetical protein
MPSRFYASDHHRRVSSHLYLQHTHRASSPQFGKDASDRTASPDRLRPARPANQQFFLSDQSGRHMRADESRSLSPFHPDTPAGTTTARGAAACCGAEGGGPHGVGAPVQLDFVQAQDGRFDLIEKKLHTRPLKE